MNGRGRPKHPDILTPREWEALALLREDRSNREIADALGVTLATARFHVSEIISKLGVANRHEAASWQPPPARDTSAWARALAPFAVMHHIKWSAAGSALGVAVIAATLLAVGFLVWGASRTFTFPASTSDASAICTPGPTLTPSSTLGPDQRRTPLPPDLRPDSTRQAEIDAGRQRNRDWTNRFIAAGCDPRPLPDFATEQFQGVGYKNPDQAIAAAELIVRAHVDATSFGIGKDADGPSAHVSLTVVENLKGDALETLALDQIGGPIRQLYWGALEHIDGLPLLLRGDDVILLLRPRRPSGAAAVVYDPLSYVGVYYLRDGRVYAGQGNPCASTIDGTPLQRVTAFIRASVERSASSPVSSAPSCGDFNATIPSSPLATVAP